MLSRSLRRRVLICTLYSNSIARRSVCRSREGSSAVQRGRRLAVAIWLVIRYLETIRDPAVLFISHGGGSRWKDKVVARSKARS